MFGVLGKYKLGGSQEWHVLGPSDKSCLQGVTRRKYEELTVP
jgi:hypothetical protein